MMIARLQEDISAIIVLDDGLIDQTIGNPINFKYHCHFAIDHPSWASTFSSSPHGT